MSKLRALVMAGATTISAISVMLPTTVAHAAAAPPIPENPCSGGDTWCRDYIVPTTWLDPSSNPVDIFLEVEFPHDASGNILPGQWPVILTYSPYSILGRNGDAAHWNDDVI